MGAINGISEFNIVEIDIFSIMASSIDATSRTGSEPDFKQTAITANIAAIEIIFVTTKSTFVTSIRSYVITPSPVRSDPLSKLLAILVISSICAFIGSVADS